MIFHIWPAALSFQFTTANLKPIMNLAVLALDEKVLWKECLCEDMNSNVDA